MKKIIIFLMLFGFNYCFGEYSSMDIILAIKYNKEDFFIKAVQDESFNPNQILEENLGQTALFFVIYHNNKKIFDLLLGLNKKIENKCKKINVNQITCKGAYFPLFFACSLHRKYFVEQLLKLKELNINQTTEKDGYSAFCCIVIRKELHDLIPFFLERSDLDLEMKYAGKTAAKLAQNLALDNKDEKEISNEYNIVAENILKTLSLKKLKKE